MRYGLISNYRRSWSKVGVRASVPNQQVFEDRYLFSAVSPTTGGSCHLIGVDGFDAEAMFAFLAELKKKHPEKLVVMVVDNAPGHRPQALRAIPGLVLLFLPPYSPELNPAERFFGELRKATANRTFKTLDDQERAIEAKLLSLANDKAALRRLVGYDWILEQTEGII